MQMEAPRSTPEQPVTHALEPWRGTIRGSEVTVRTRGCSRLPMALAKVEITMPDSVLGLLHESIGEVFATLPYELQGFRQIGDVYAALIVPESAGNAPYKDWYEVKARVVNCVEFSLETCTIALNVSYHSSMDDSLAGDAISRRLVQHVLAKVVPAVSPPGPESEVSP